MNKIQSATKELGITIRQLAKELGMSEPGLRNASSLATNGKEIGKQTQRSISMLLKMKQQEADLKDFEMLKEIIGRFGNCEVVKS